MQGGQGQARVIQEVTNCVVIRNQSQYSLTDLEPPPCELCNDVGINLLGSLLQEIRVISHILSNNRTDSNQHLFLRKCLECRILPLMSAERSKISDYCKSANIRKLLNFVNFINCKNLLT